MGSEQNSQKKPVVLIVDDVPENIKVLGNTLRNRNYVISAALSGEQALEIINQSLSPDLILLDVMMPGMNGFEVCAKLKSSPATNEIPIIFLTAKTETEDIVKGFEVGAVDYLTKPFNTAELLARVRTHLELKAAKDRQKELIGSLEKALEEVKTLSGFIPICSYCKKIRDDKGFWEQVESYVGKRSTAQFSHGICPDCVKKYYPDMAEELLKDEKS